MNAAQWIEAHKDCPLSFLLTHVCSERNREPAVIGKAFWGAVLDQLSR